MTETPTFSFGDLPVQLPPMVDCKRCGHLDIYHMLTGSCSVGNAPGLGTYKPCKCPGMEK